MEDEYKLKCHLCQEMSVDVRACGSISCCNKVCINCRSDKCNDVATYTMCVKCKEKRDRAAVENERQYAERAAMELFSQNVVRIEVGVMCRNSLPCYHDVMAYDSRGRCRRLGYLDASTIQHMLVKFRQPPNPHIEHRMRLFYSLLPYK